MALFYYFFDGDHALIPVSVIGHYPKNCGINSPYAQMGF